MNIQETTSTGRRKGRNDSGKFSTKKRELDLNEKS